jgi:hypothetical protein
MKMDLAAQMQVPYDLNNPKDIQVRHPDVAEGTFHSCSSHLHVLLVFFYQYLLEAQHLLPVLEQP